MAEEEVGVRNSGSSEANAVAVGGGGGGGEIHRVILISADASHSLALLCKSPSLSHLYQASKCYSFVSFDNKLENDSKNN